jgi:hypothetical protein
LPAVPCFDDAQKPSGTECQQGGTVKIADLAASGAAPAATQIWTGPPPPQQGLGSGQRDLLYGWIQRTS